MERRVIQGWRARMQAQQQEAVDQLWGTATTFIEYLDYEVYSPWRELRQAHRTVLVFDKEVLNTLRLLRNERRRRARGMWTSDQRNQVRKAAAAWRARNPEKVASYAKAFRDRHPEKVREWNRRWAQENPDKARAKQKRYRERHPEKVKARQKSNYSAYMTEERREQYRIYQQLLKLAGLRGVSGS